VTTSSDQAAFDRLPDDVKGYLLQLGKKLMSLPVDERRRAGAGIVDYVMESDPDPETRRAAEAWRRRYAS
jgi:hypothetical protein